MSEETVQIKRYPNRRFYGLGSSRYLCLADIEELVREGKTVEIRDSQSGEDITRVILTQLIIERHPDKIALFPASMLHVMLRANDMVAGFLRDYFRNSLSYLEYLQQHGPTIEGVPPPMHWMKAWFQPPAKLTTEKPKAAPPESQDSSDVLARRVEQLERRLRKLESSPSRSREDRDPD